MYGNFFLFVPLSTRIINERSYATIVNSTETDDTSHGTMGVAWSLDFTIITVVGSPRTRLASGPWAFRRPGCPASRYTSRIRAPVYRVRFVDSAGRNPAGAGPAYSVLRRLSRPTTIHKCRCGYVYSYFT